MVSLTNTLIAVVAATGVAAQQHTNCPNGRLLCGWYLNSGTFGKKFRPLSPLSPP